MISIPDNELYSNVSPIRTGQGRSTHTGNLWGPSTLSIMGRSVLSMGHGHSHQISSILFSGPSVIEFDPTVGFPKRDTRRVMKKPAEEDVKKVASEKSAKTLLGEFYKDREFLEQIASDQTLQSLDMNDQAESVLQIIRLVYVT